MKKNFIHLILISLLVIMVTASVDKPRSILIIGDSISMGYTPFIQKTLAPDALVEHNPGNGGSTLRGVENIEKWLDNKEWDVIVFNFGLHDLVHKDSLNKYDVNGKVAVTLEEYERNLNLIAQKLRETTAVLIFINTTMVPENASGRKVEDPAKYNEVAKKVMCKYGIKVLDLYSTSLTIHPHNSKPGNVHYTQKGYEELSKYITIAIKDALK